MNEDKQNCALCQKSTDDEIKFGNMLESGDLRVHHYCLLFGPGLPQNGSDNEGIEGFLVEDIKKEINRIKHLKCVYCNEKKANLGCCNSACPKAYHTECAIKHKVVFNFNSTFQTFCSNHKRIRQIDRKKLDSKCGMCYENLKKSYPESILIPCCKNSWYHKDCLQKYALSSGVNFKCPMCSSKNCMTQLLSMGIFFPERDALWEFDESYRPLNLICEDANCPEKIKDMDEVHKWKICDYCGSNGIHFQCLKTDPNKRYTCTDCKNILYVKKPKKQKSFASIILGESDVSSDEELT